MQQAYSNTVGTIWFALIDKCVRVCVCVCAHVNTRVVYMYFQPLIVH